MPLRSCLISAFAIITHRSFCQREFGGSLATKKCVSSKILTCVLLEKCYTNDLMDWCKCCPRTNCTKYSEYRHCRYIVFLFRVNSIFFHERVVIAHAYIGSLFKLEFPFLNHIYFYVIVCELWKLSFLPFRVKGKAFN